MSKKIFHKKLGHVKKHGFLLVKASKVALNPPPIYHQLIKVVEHVRVSQRISTSM